MNAGKNNDQITRKLKENKEGIWEDSERRGSGK